MHNIEKNHLSFLYRTPDDMSAEIINAIGADEVIANDLIKYAEHRDALETGRENEGY